MFNFPHSKAPYVDALFFWRWGFHIPLLEYYPVLWCQYTFARRDTMDLNISKVFQLLVRKYRCHLMEAVY